VASIESDDYKRWTAPELVLAPDFQDGLNLQLYGSSFSHYVAAENAYFMLPAGYHVREGAFVVQVAVSRDNRTWLRPTRDCFIPLGPPGAFDDHIISVAPGFVPAGKDDVALYYRSGNMVHGGALQSSVPKDGRTLAGGMGRVPFKRDRVVGIEAASEGGGFWTRPLLFEGRTLAINAEPTGPDARLEVQLLSVGTAPPPAWARGDGVNDGACRGFAFEDCIPSGEDALDSFVRWKQGPSVADWAGKPVRLQFRLRSMRVYAFQFRA
jgi:hypothetical protein